jgi:hypothetical protein
VLKDYRAVTLACVMALAGLISACAPPAPADMADSGWIEPGAARPLPALDILMSAPGGRAGACLELIPVEGGRDGCARWAVEPQTPACEPADQACQRRNWAALLAMVQDAELSAPAGGRSYRNLDVVEGGLGDTRLDVRPDGSGVLIKSGTGQTQGGVLTTGPRREIEVPAAAVAEFEAKLKRAGFDSVPVAASQPPKNCQPTYEGLAEAVVGGRYRWLASGACRPGDRELDNFGLAFLDLEALMEPAPEAS